MPIKNIAKSKNGVILKISEDKVEKVGQISIQAMVLDGKRLLSAKSEIIKTRNKLVEVGAVFVNMIINLKYKILQTPVISAPGGFDLGSDLASKEILIEDIVDSYNEAIRQINDIRKDNKNKFLTNIEKENFLSQNIRTAINKFYDADVGKKPYIEILFTKIG